MVIIDIEARATYGEIRWKSPKAAQIERYKTTIPPELIIWLYLWTFSLKNSPAKIREIPNTSPMTTWPTGPINPLSKANFKKKTTAKTIATIPTIANQLAANLNSNLCSSSGGFSISKVPEIPLTCSVLSSLGSFEDFLKNPQKN